VVDAVCDKLGSGALCTTAKGDLPGADLTELERAKTQAKSIAKEHGITEEVLNHLVSLYGSRYKEVLGYVKKDKRLRERICRTNPDIMAEVVHAVEKESALTLSDFMIRRSLIAWRRCEGLDCCMKVAKTMGKLLRWSNHEISVQVAAYKNEIAIRHVYEKKPSKPTVRTRKRVPARRKRSRRSR
jgi:glycerol-3-phosphate dehydrogenase